MLEDGNFEADARGVLTFRDVRAAEGWLVPMIAPASAWSALRDSALLNLTADPAEMRVFALSAL